LIRTRRDRGMVVILDPRVRTKPYGQLFLDSLPDCKVVVESGQGKAEKKADSGKRKAERA
jgi:Rad3-related DNA helicase